MTMEVYWGSGSPYAWRVLLAMEIKKLPYESRLLAFDKGEHKTADYLKLNPRGQVPALKDGDVVLWESLAILAYLDRKHPEPPLFGRTAAETGAVWRVISESVSYLEPACVRVVLPVFTGKTAENEADMRAAAKEAHDELTALERRLAGASWLGTDGPSAADIAVYPMLELTLRAAGKDAAKPLNLGFLPLADRYPGIARWMGRIRALPGYERTYPPHWRQVDKAADKAAE